MMNAPMACLYSQIKAWINTHPMLFHQANPIYADGSNYHICLIHLGMYFYILFHPNFTLTFV